MQVTFTIDETEEVFDKEVAAIPRIGEKAYFGAMKPTYLVKDVIHHVRPTDGWVEIIISPLPSKQ